MLKELWLRAKELMSEPKKGSDMNDIQFWLDRHNKGRI